MNTTNGFKDSLLIIHMMEPTYYITNVRDPDCISGHVRQNVIKEIVSKGFEGKTAIPPGDVDREDDAKTRHKDLSGQTLDTELPHSVYTWDFCIMENFLRPDLGMVSPHQ